MNALNSAAAVSLPLIDQEPPSVRRGLTWTHWRWMKPLGAWPEWNPHDRTAYPMGKKKKKNSFVRGPQLSQRRVNMYSRRTYLYYKKASRYVLPRKARQISFHFNSEKEKRAMKRRPQKRNHFWCYLAFLRRLSASSLLWNHQRREDFVELYVL
jgi:hypothetical protein